ncbi:hypothetical protein [Chromobacterium vaccinii]|uniref:hypothetical protein n=1 Tax=Chromobacterium vaccinii TaxID=1108595 RepID=UPI001642614F|nr:hypothetical protein [Chromobacterium vaccinii]
MDYAKADRDGDKVRQRASQPAEPLLVLRHDLMKKVVQAFQHSMQPSLKRKKK